MTLRALVVDDERPARDKIENFLADDPDVRLVGQCANGLEAVRAIRDERPDLVFLDVQMPELDGFQVVEEVGVEQMPTVVFVTAYDEHAIRAFEVSAADYLLKPFSRPRFDEALVRAKKRAAEEHTPTSRVGRVLRALEEDSPADRLVIRSTGRIQIVDTSGVDWIEADGNYARLWVGGASYLMRSTLSALEERLRGGPFLRVHRSRIVNGARIRELRPGDHGEYTLVLEDGTEVRSSRAYYERISEWLAGGD